MEPPLPKSQNMKKRECSPSDPKEKMKSHEDPTWEPNSSDPKQERLIFTIIFVVSCWIGSLSDNLPIDKSNELRILAFIAFLISFLIILKPKPRRVTMWLCGYCSLITGLSAIGLLIYVCSRNRERCGCRAILLSSPCFLFLQLRNLCFYVFCVIGQKVGSARKS